MRLFRSRSIGLDIDHGSLKAVEVSQGRGAYTLHHVGYRRLPREAIAGGEVADAELLASELREFWGTHSFGSRSVYLGVANNRVVVRLINLPRMEEKDLQGAIRFEAQDHIPMPVDETVLDYVVLGPSPDEELDRILLVAAHREMVSAFSSAVRAAGLRPAGVDVKSLCLLRSMLPPSLFDDEGATLLLDVSAETTSLVISQGAAPTVTRFIPGGAESFLAAAAEAAGISAEEAEERVFDLDLAGDPEETTEQPAGRRGVREGLEEAVQLLAEDVRRSIDYHNQQPFASEVDRGFVSGEGSMIPGFERYLEGVLGIPVHRGRPLEKIEQNGSNVSDEDLRAMEPVLSVAMGLAFEEA
ncbi:type IV pilus assembly protein PilM [Rubrobacter taiwanensis]|uniref:type IV pilus assembly protein PilM n=1 Tax=Rubrobacter taiwanensis TaxID=185139 RepID=UPI001404C6B2|nr:type IV pilus assembly protein PilM [Rubrobacter taiwanensis]